MSRPSGLLVDPATGRFLPPAGVQERLRQIDPALGLEWFDDPFCWGITWQWRDDDPRREMIQRGEIPEGSDRDVLAFAPPTMSLDDAYHHLTLSLRTHNKPEIRSMLDNLHRWNEQVIERSGEELTDDLAAAAGKAAEARGSGMAKTQVQVPPGGGEEKATGKGSKGNKAK